MIRRGGCLGVLLVAGALASGGAAGIPAALKGALEAPATQSARVLRVIDGDTLLVYRSGETERVRLVGIDAPETSSTRYGYPECGGRAASAATRNWVRQAGQRVHLSGDRLAPARDRYGRLLASVTDARGRDLAGWLVSRGLARTVFYEHRPLAAHPRLLSLEANARGRHTGLWSSCPRWARWHAIPFAARPPGHAARDVGEDLVDPQMVALFAFRGAAR
jgi:micrococcal nuclease